MPISWSLAASPAPPCSADQLEDGDARKGNQTQCGHDEAAGSTLPQPGSRIVTPRRNRDPHKDERRNSSRENTIPAMAAGAFTSIEQTGIGATLTVSRVGRLADIVPTCNQGHER